MILRKELQIRQTVVEELTATVEGVSEQVEKKCEICKRNQ